MSSSNDSSKRFIERKAKGPGKASQLAQFAPGALLVLVDDRREGKTAEESATASWSARSPLPLSLEPGLERSAVLIAPGFPLCHTPRFLIDLSHFARMLRAGEFYEY